MGWNVDIMTDVDETTTDEVRDSRYQPPMHTDSCKKRNKKHQSYSTRIAGPPSFNSANDTFLACAFPSSGTRPTSFVQIHVDAYMLTLPTR